MKITIKGLKLTESQKLIYDAANDKQHKYVMCNLSRQQGKTTTMILLCIQWLCQKNQEIIYFTPTYVLAKNIFSKLIKLLPSEFIVKNNAQELIIETVIGTSIRFFSGEAAQSARGSNCTKLIIDEAAYIKNEIDGQSFYYNIVLPLTKVHCDKIIMVSTPFGKSGFYYELCMRALAGDENMIYILRTIYDDALISKEQIEELKKGYPELAWKTEFLCEFLTNALSVFPDYEQCFKDYNFNYTGRLWCGIDLSSVGSDRTVVTFVNEQNETKQYVITGDLDSKYKQISTLLNSHNNIIGTYIEVNSIGEVMSNEIKKQLKRKTTFHEFVTTNDSKKEQIGRISVLIANNQISFNKENKLLYSELGTYTYQLTKVGNITYNAIAGAHDDTIMSLALALQCKEDYRFDTASNINFVKNYSRRFI